MQSAETALKVHTIFNDIQKTNIQIGETKGFFVSREQLAHILGAYAEIGLAEYAAGISLRDPEEEELEAGLRSQRKEVARKIRIVELQLKQSSSSKAVDLNLQQGRLLSERARIDRALKEFE